MRTSASKGCFMGCQRIGQGPLGAPSGTAEQAHGAGAEKSRTRSMKMRSAQLGKHTSNVEVTNVSKHGFWLLLQDREVFLAFNQFPWFREAPIRKLLNVELPQPHHLYWPDLDIDLAVESIDHPE